MNLNPNPRRLANLLIQTLKNKFDFELKSKVYQVIYFKLLNKKK
jgi:hypothetical protein